MKIIASMLIAVVIIPLTSLPFAAGRRSSGSGSARFYGGGGFGRFGGYNSGFGGYRGGGRTPADPKPGSGDSYKGSGNIRGKPTAPRDTSITIVVIPKPVLAALPKVCKPDVEACITKHISGKGGKAKHGGQCCVKLKNAVPCICVFITAKEPKVRAAADGVLRSCRYNKPVCIKLAMPQSCRPEVRNCVNTHLYGYGAPPYNGACCKKFKTSRTCVTQFLNSPDPKLSESANAILRSCRFRKP